MEAIENYVVLKYNESYILRVRKEKKTYKYFFPDG